VAPDPPLRAAIRTTVFGRSPTGIYFWLVDYENTGGLVISKPAAAVRFLDANGESVGDLAGWAMPDSLEPGARVPVLVTGSEPPVHQRADVVLRAPERTTGPVLKQPLLVTEVATQVSAPRQWKITGTITNDRGTDLDFVELHAVGREASGRLVAYAPGMAPVRRLAAGASTPFTLEISEWVAGEPQAWTVQAWARPGPAAERR
jgi:hypothetical protein